MSCVRGAIAGVIALLLSSCATPGEPIAEPSLSTPASPSPSPSEAPPSPSPSASTGWELVRYDHPTGLFSFSYPRGWTLIDEPPSESRSLSLSNYQEPASSGQGFRAADIKFNVALTLYDRFETPGGRELFVDGLSGRYRLYSGDELGAAAEGSGAALAGGAVFELRAPIGRFTGIGVTMQSGSDNQEIRDLFLDVVKSLKVHQ